MRKNRTRLILQLVLLFQLSTSLYSQDLIVTSSGDSIPCRISMMKDSMLFFTFLYKDSIRNTLLPIENVKFYQFQYSKIPFVPNRKIYKKESYSHVKIDAIGGWSYWVANLNDEVEPSYSGYKKDLRTGYHLGAEFSYYFTEPLGFGMKYCIFKSSHHLNGVNIQRADGSVFSGNISDHVTISFIGIYISSRWLDISKKNAIILNIAAGYITYDNVKIRDQQYHKKGSNIGFSYDFGYAYTVYRNLALETKISYTSGRINSYSHNNGVTTVKTNFNEDDSESLNHLDVSVGIRFNSAK